MEFHLRVKDRAYAIFMDGDQVSVERFSLGCQVVRAEGNRFTVAVDGIHYDVELRESEGGQQIAIVEGIEYPVEAIGLARGRPARPRRAPEPAAPAPEAVEGALMAMMPSKVIEVRVKEGERVQADQVILILEAMKMESELRAPRAGVVTAVHCAPGDSVDPGVALVVIEPCEE